MQPSGHSLHAGFSTPVQGSTLNSCIALPYLVAIVIEGGQAVLGRPCDGNVVPGAVRGCDAGRVVSDAALILHYGDAPAMHNQGSPQL